METEKELTDNNKAQLKRLQFSGQDKQYYRQTLPWKSKLLSNVSKRSTQTSLSQMYLYMFLYFHGDIT